MKQISKNFKGHVPQLVLGPLFKLFEAVLELFVPVVVADIIDVGISAADTGYIIRGGLILLALAVAGLCASITCQYFAAVVAGWFGRGLRKQLFEHVMKLSGSETTQFGAGGMITRITNDTNQIQGGINMFIRLATRAPFLIIGGLVMALRLNFRMGLIFLATIPVLALILFFIMRITLPSYVHIQQRQEDLAKLSGENLAGARVIRAFSRQKDEEEELNLAAVQLEQLMVRVGRVSSLLNPLTNIVASLAIAGLVWVGGGLTFNGQSTPGEIVAMVSYINQVVLSMVIAANLIVLFTRAAASIKRVNALLDTLPSIVDGPGAEAVNGAPAIEFNKVNFAYHEGASHALENINLTIKHGETIGIIGGTASGKSTLANLIMRYYDVYSGNVKVDGCDVRNYTLHQLRQNIGFVPQNTQLFSGTIAYNLQMAKPDATEDEMLEALSAAQAKAFVQDKEDELETEIVEGGKNLSGGQRQRLTIARALVKQPQILILDDSSSALDFATDAKLRAALSEMCRQKSMTVIMISQRAASIMHANRIVLMDDGHIAGIGSHKQLLRDNEIYREICASQGITMGGDAL